MSYLDFFTAVLCVTTLVLVVFDYVWRLFLFRLAYVLPIFVALWVFCICLIAKIAF